MDTAGTDDTEDEEPRYYSQAGAEFMYQELQRLRTENEELRRDVVFWQDQQITGICAPTTPRPDRRLHPPTRSPHRIAKRQPPY
jgi:hypothetical protein